MKTDKPLKGSDKLHTLPAKDLNLANKVQELMQANEAIQARDRELLHYIREKTDQLLNVMGTLPLKPEELDDDTLISIDPIGIVGESFGQVLEHLKETNENLLFAMEELQAIFDSAGAGILVVDMDKKLTAFNQKSRDLFFPNIPDPTGSTCLDFVCGEASPPDDCILEKVFSTGKTQTNPNFATQDKLYEVIGTPIKNNAEQLTHVILVYTDITERTNQEKALRESEKRYRTLYSTMQEGVAQHRLLYDENGIPCDYAILDINNAYETIVGLNREQVVGKKASEVYPLINNAPPCLDIFSRIILSGNAESFEYDFEELGKIISVSAAKLADDHFATVFEDVTERKQAEERIEKLAYFDSLTGLPNRILMRDRLCQMAARAQRGTSQVGLLFLDLDHFKRVNDTLGHDTGDRLLKIVADRLQTVLRSCDSICRLGGDEFVILIDDIKDRENAAMIACKILEALSKPAVLKEREVYTSTSIGICMYPEDGDDPDTLLKNADTAMYRAKEEGRNTYCFYSSEMNSKALEQLLLANDLRKALERDEFYLVYQPQIDLGHRQMTGVEALLRWRHADLGDISPTQFIPLAEETGLILTIGDWVLKNACQQAVSLQEQTGAPLRMAVNLSTKQFQDPSLVSKVKKVLKNTGLAPSYLELEITESILMDNVDNAQRVLQELKQMGVKLSIDDFGTGYSSLSYLRHFPIDRLKIDKTFIQRICTHPDDAAITEAIIVMGHTIGTKIVAEGVEHKEELNFLQDKKCDEVQGFYFSRPLSPKILVELITDRAAFCFFEK